MKRPEASIVDILGLLVNALALAVMCAALAVALGWKPTFVPIDVSALARITSGAVGLAMLAYLAVFPARNWLWGRMRPWLARRTAFGLTEDANCEEIGFHIALSRSNESQNVFAAIGSGPLPIRQAQIEIRLQKGAEGSIACGLNVCDAGGRLLTRLLLRDNGQVALKIRKQDDQFGQTVLAEVDPEAWHTFYLQRTREGIRYGVDGDMREQQCPPWPVRVGLSVGVWAERDTRHTADVRRIWHR